MIEIYNKRAIGMLQEQGVAIFSNLSKKKIQRLSLILRWFPEAYLVSSTSSYTPRLKEKYLFYGKIGYKDPRNFSDRILWAVVDRKFAADKLFEVAQLFEEKGIEEAMKNEYKF